MSAPILITGCARSGTTLLARILGSHDKLMYNSELKFLKGLKAFWDSPRSLAGLRHNGVTDDVTLRFLGDFAESLYDQVHCSKHNARIIDKSPDYYDILPWISEVFDPDTRIIVVVRHGLDVANSLVGEMAPGGAGGFIDDVVKPWVDAHGGDLAGACRWWAHCNEVMLDSGVESHIVKYEDLLSDPIAETEACLDYIGVEHDIGNTSAMLDEAFKAPHPMGWGDRKFRQTRAIEPSRANRWRQWFEGKHVPLSRLVNPVLSRFGYGTV